MEKSARLAELYARLTAAPAAAGHDQAFDLLERMVNAVEDEMSGVPYNPASSHNDGRMYPPSREFEVDSDTSGSRCYRQRGHKTYIGLNGAIKIVKLGSTQVVLSKAGADGKEL